MFGRKCHGAVYPLLWTGAAAFAVLGMVGAYAAVCRMAPGFCRKAKTVKKDCVDACRKICEDVASPAFCGCGTADGCGDSGADNAAGTDAAETQNQ